MSPSAVVLVHSPTSRPIEHVPTDRGGVVWFDRDETRQFVVFMVCFSTHSNT